MQEGGSTVLMLYQGWVGLLRTLVVGVLAYVGLLLFLRIAGKRTLSKMNAFDFLVTVALGSTLATVLLNKETALAEGLVAFGVLIGLQFAVTWSSVRWSRIRAVVTGEPVIVARAGRILPDAARRARVAESEIQAAVRAAGLAGLDAVDAVVLETDGSFSVIRAAGD